MVTETAHDLLMERIRQIVDCGCCSINESAVMKIAQWWESTHAAEEGLPEEDNKNGTTINDCYLFYNYVTYYCPSVVKKEFLPTKFP
jgi:hypothetical protein